MTAQSTRRRRSMTDQAADAAVDQACRSLVAHHPVQVHRDCRRRRTRAADLSRIPRRLAARRTGRPRRRRRHVEYALAYFPRAKWQADFDYDANPAINAATIHTLARAASDEKGEPLCLICDSGTGTSSLLIGLGTAAARDGHRVRYTSATKLVSELAEAADKRQPAKTIAPLRTGRPALHRRTGIHAAGSARAELLFQVLTEREETASVAITSNESFSGLTETFTDPRLCAAIVDPLTLAGNIIESGTQSYRLAHVPAARTAGQP